jgi:hypothetical protein
MKSVYFRPVFLFCLGFLLVCNSAFAQNEDADSYVQFNDPSKKVSQENKKDNIDFKERLRYGGSFGAFFGSQTYIELSPKVGYKVNNRLVAGLGLNYIYFSFKDYGQKFVTHIYGPTIFAQYGLVSGLFAYGEYNAYNIASYNPLPPYNTERVWIGSAPVGLGYYSGGQIGGVYIAVLYDLINNPASPYYNGSVPILLRVGFLF